MKPLYTQEEFEKGKSSEKFSCQCYYCGKPFEKAKRDIKKVLNKVPGFTGKYCSQLCCSKNKIKQKVLNVKCVRR